MLKLIILCLFNVVWTIYIPPGPRYRCPQDKLLLYPCKCDFESDVGVNVHCENTNLARMSVALNNLATFNLPVERLTIFRCNFSRLFGSLLYNLKVRILHIEDTPIEQIDEFAFLGVNNTLKELHLLRSLLENIPSSAFKILGNLTVLNIDGHHITELSGDVLSGSNLAGKLQKLHIINGILSTISAEAFQPLKKLKTLDLHGNKLQQLKRNQFKGLRETEVLDLSFNSITKIDSSHIGDMIKLGWCNASHNNLKEITRGAFSRNAVLKLLNLSHNNITKLDSNTFRGMRFLRRLYLSDNQISDVGRGTFGTVTRIGTIDLARNLLKKIDFQMFYQLNFIEVIDVSENNVTEIQRLAFKDLFLTSINLSRNSIEKIEPGAFENCVNITILDLSHNKISNFTNKTFDETTYATELQLSYNFFTSVNQVPLANMHGLKILNMSHNWLTNIPKNTFPKLYELHTIDFSHNNLSDIFNSVFQTLFSLRNLNLSYNHLETIKPSMFGTIPTLLHLDLSFNLLKDIAKGALTRLASMRTLLIKGNNLQKIFQLPISVSHLDLSENELHSLPPKFWPTMNSLLSLDLSYNQLGENLEKGSFENLITLQRLNLNFNGIKKVPWAALSDLSSLQYLYLEGNEVEQLPKAAFGNLPVLFELNLSNNKIYNISKGAFEGLLQLLVLNLANNNISVIPNGALSKLVSLRKVDFSFNTIEKLGNKTNSLFEDCLSLETIVLKHNKISFITRKTFPSNPYIPYKLKEVDLSYNIMPLITFDLISGTEKLQSLNLSHNAIADIRRGVLGNLTQLKTLDLSFNKIKALSEEVVELPKNISEINFSYNEFEDLPWKKFENATELKKLDLSFNNFQRFHPELLELINRNISINFEGNPLKCDCFARPIRRYFHNHLELTSHYNNIKCESPPQLINESLIEVPDELLICPKDLHTTNISFFQGEYAVTPDLKFSTLQGHKCEIILKWQILKNEDIADVYLTIRNIRNYNDILLEKQISYNQRKTIIQCKDYRLAANKTNDYEICILGRDSKDFVRSFYKEQCQLLEHIIKSGNINVSASLSFTTLFTVFLIGFWLAV